MRLAAARQLPAILLAACATGCIGTVPADESEKRLPYDPLLLTKEEVREDKEIAKAIRALIKKLNRTHRADLHLEANVHRGIVLLSGEAPSRTFDISGLVEQLEDLEQVRRVHNYAMGGQGPSPFRGQGIANAWLELQVKASIGNYDPILGRRLKIVCHSQMVFVMGLAYESEVERISQAVRRIPNVRRVHLLLETVPGKPLEETQESETPGNEASD